MAPELLMELAAHPHEWLWDEAQIWATRAPSQGTASLTGSPTGGHPTRVTTPPVSRFGLLVVLEMP